MAFYRSLLLFGWIGLSFLDRGSISISPASGECPKHFEEIGSRLPRDWRRVKDKILIPIEEDKLYVGMQVREKFGGAQFTHSYMMFRGKRFDGDPVRIRTAHTGSKNIATDNSILFEYKIDDPEVLSSIEESISKQNRFTWTCAQGNCSILREAGLDPGIGGISQLFPTRLMERLKEKGLMGPDGNPLQVKIFQLGSMSLEEMSRRGFPVELGRGAAYLAVVGTSGMVLYGYLDE